MGETLLLLFFREDQLGDSLRVRPQLRFLPMLVMYWRLEPKRCNDKVRHAQVGESYAIC
jgi:hypothetical protein